MKNRPTYTHRTSKFGSIVGETLVSTDAAKAAPTRFITLVVIGLTSLHSANVWANPQDGQVVAGSAAITQATPNKVDITQTTDKAIIDWNSFSINANEHTAFHQPSAGSVTLNRVVGEDPSQILGRLTANGQVFLVNPNGIYFGKNAQVDVAGLVASTHNIRNEDFLAGRYNFNIPGKPGASVINEGTINIADTGIAAFVAPSAANRGVIVAKLGRVVLAAANGFTLDFHGDELLTFLVNDEVAKTAFDLEGKQLTSFVENAGRIEAQGGYVLMTAKAAENAIHSVINQSGSIEATTVGTHNGEIILNAGKGSLSVSGTLDASAPSGGDGGFIETSGGHVAIDPATRITTAALFGKTGRWLIDPTDYTIAASGGDITGAALASYLGASNVEIQTNDVTTSTSSNTSMGMGNSSGNVGSGLSTDTGTPGGTAGTGVTQITDAGGANFSGNGDNGDIFVNDSVTWNNFNKLTLTAHRNIYVNEAINGTGGSVKLRADSLGTGVGTVAFSGNGHITVNNGAAVGIYYNPVSYTNTATKSDANGNPYSAKVSLNGGATLTANMLVNDVNQLQAMSTNLSGNYALGKDIDASVTAGWNSGAGFVPVGRDRSEFTGTFDGLGHTLSNLTINRPQKRYYVDFFSGLFGVISKESTIHNVGLIGGSVVGHFFIGGLVGVNGGMISNSYTTGSVNGTNFVGGLVGKNLGTISNSYATGNVSGADYVGGLVGATQYTISYDVGGFVGATISNSYATGNVSGTDRVGGLVGSNFRSFVSNSYATGNVSGVNEVGGLVGNSDGLVKNSYATGIANGVGNVGGLVGNNQYLIINSYWDTQTSGQVTSTGGTGLTTAQMKQQASYSNWDFANTWQITEGVSRPTLKVASTQAVVTVLKPEDSAVADAQAAQAAAAAATAAAKKAQDDAQAAADAKIAADKAKADADQAATDKANAKTAADKAPAEKAQLEAKAAADKAALDAKTAANKAAEAAQKAQEEANAAAEAKAVAEIALASANAKETADYNALTDAIIATEIAKATGKLQAKDAVIQATSTYNASIAATIAANHSLAMAEIFANEAKVQAQKAKNSADEAKKSAEDAKQIADSTSNPGTGSNHTPAPIITNGFRAFLTPDQAYSVLEVSQQFNYAIGSDGRFNVNLLSSSDLKIFIATLSSNNVSLSFDNFGGELGMELKERTEEHFRYWDKALDDSLKKVNSTEGISASDYVELADKTLFNMVSGAVDTATLPMSGVKFGANAIKRLERLTPVLKGLSIESKSAKDLIAVFGSNEFKLLGLLIDNSFASQNEARRLISNDKSLQEQMKNIGITATDIGTGALNLGKLQGLLANKVGQASLALIADTLTGDVKLNDDFLVNLGSSVGEFVPVIGPAIKQAKIVSEVLGRQKPETVAAFKEYMGLQKNFRKDTDKLSEDTQRKRLQMTLDASERVKKENSWLWGFMGK
jgi:filamentous hemagglutinin family protein